MISLWVSGPLLSPVFGAELSRDLAINVIPVSNLGLLDF
jgi:hypothetical protein